MKKRFLSFLLALIMIIPAVNFNAAAQTFYLTVNYTGGGQTLKDILTAEGISAGEAISILAVTGNGALTEDDVGFIRDNLTVTSLNLTESRFEDDTVPDRAFKNYGSLRSIALPPDTVKIGESAFEGCYSLINIGLIANLREIGRRAFANCASLETFALTDNIISIGENAFQGSGLTGIIAMRNNGAEYNAAANIFSGVSAQLVIPAGAAGYDSAPFAGLNKAEWKFYRFPETVQAIAGSTVELSVEVTDINNRPAEYQWFHEGRQLFGMTGDTLVISDLDQQASGRYGVRVTIGGVSVIFASTVETAGYSARYSTYATKNIAPDRTAEPEKIIYDYADANGIETKIEPVNSVVRQTVDFGRASEYSYTLYVQKVRELFQAHRDGHFELNLPDSARLEVPFSLINTRDDLADGDKISINISRAAEGYSVTCAISKADGRVIEFLVLASLPPVYMYYPASGQTENHVIMIKRDGKFYPVPSLETEDNILKFQVQESSDYVIILAPERGVKFSDTAGHWGESEIISSAALHIVEGYPDGSYQPDGELTRTEFTAMLARVARHNSMARPTHLHTPRSFSDVRNGDWFYESVRLAEQMGLLGFITDSRFLPDTAITREEMSEMIAQAQLVLAGVELVHLQRDISYSDISEIDSRFLDAVRITTNTGLLQGAGGRFMPKKTLTRAEAAAVLNRLFDWLAGGIK